MIVGIVVLINVVQNSIPVTVITQRVEVVGAFCVITDTITVGVALSIIGVKIQNINHTITVPIVDIVKKRDFEIDLSNGFFFVNYSNIVFVSFIFSLLSVITKNGVLAYRKLSSDASLGDPQTRQANFTELCQGKTISLKIIYLTLIGVDGSIKRF